MTPNFFQTQMDYIYFFYGLAFILLTGVTTGLNRLENQKMPWHWLCLFGIFHGVNEWLDLLAHSLVDTDSFSAFRLMVMGASFLFLIEFGRTGTRNITGKAPGRWIYGPLVLMAALGASAGISGLNAAFRYVLGLTGGLWATMALWQHGQKNYPGKRPLMLAALSMGLYGWAMGAVGPFAPFFPARFINQDLFLSITGFPIQLMRGVLAFAAAASLQQHYFYHCRLACAAFSGLESRLQQFSMAAIAALLIFGGAATHWAGKLGEEYDEFEYMSDLKLAKESFESNVSTLDRLIQSLSSSPALRGLSSDNRLDLDAVNATLDRYAKINTDSICYVMDSTGLTVASSNRHSPDSFVGKNYAVRPYFSEAVQGRRGHYVAVGLTSNVPGYYSSCPVRDALNRVVAVAVFKLNIVHLFGASFQRHNGFLVDPNGIILAASQPGFILKALWAIPGDARNGLIRSGQFPSIPETALLPMTSLPRNYFSFQGKFLRAFQQKTAVEGLSFVMLGPMHAWKMLRLMGILVTLLAAVLLVAFFVAQQKKIESIALITASETRYRSLIEGSPNWIGHFDKEGRCITVNKAGLDKMGQTLPDVQGKSFDDIWTEKTHPAAEDAVQRVLAGERVSFEAVQYRPDGTRFNGLLYLNANREQDETIQSFVCIANDIGNYKKIEAALRKSEAAVLRKLYAITEPEGDIGTLELPDIIDTDAIQSLMTDFYELTRIGFSILDLSGTPLVQAGWQDICTDFHRQHPEALSNCLESDRDVIAGIPAGTFRTCRCKNNLPDMVTPLTVGGRHLGNIHFGQFFYEDDPPDLEIFRKQARRFGFDETAYLEALNRVPRWRRETVSTAMAFYAKLADMISTLSYSQIRLSRTLAERERAEEELLHLNDTLEQRVAQEVAKNMEHERLMIRQSRMAAMGEMIGNIAHQWRQPLNALGLLLFNIQDAFRFGSLDAPFLDQSIKDGNRLIQKMSTTISDFSDFFRPDKERAAFSALEQIRQATALVSASFANSRIGIHIDAARDLMLFGFPNEYSQVLLNLLSNASEAIQGADCPVPGRVEIRLVRQDDQGCLSVCDNGGGIPTDILDRMFDPYFSTKQKGSGIGLYMSKMIIERNMNGRITARNIDAGAEVTVCVPLADGTGKSD